MKNFKTTKQIILDISLVILICILILGIIYIYNKTMFVSTNIITDDNSQITIPNVTKDNTTFKISDTKNKVKSVNITATKRLAEYDLYYYITFDSNDSLDINNTDYSLLNDTILIIDENCTIYFKYGLDGNYSEEFYEIKVSNIKTTNTTSDKVSEKELKEEKVDKNDIPKQSTSPYFIKVNYGANVVTIYTKDEDGNYTVPYKAMICSCGKYTPKSGTYKTSNKYAWRPLVHDVYGQYATRIIKKILFHSVPYSTNRKNSLLYEEYDKLGTKASEGCVRLTVKDAKWIYDNCPSGTMVEFYSDSNPGPLGKPSAQKISSIEEYRNWDPTDPATENPWHTYKKEEEKPSEDIQNNVTTDITNNIINNTIDNNIINNNSVNENINNTIDNNIDTNIANESINNLVINNSTIDNSSNNNTTTENTNPTINNTILDNNIDNNTTNTDNTLDNSNNINHVYSNNSSNTENTLNNEIINSVNITHENIV